MAWLSRFRSHFLTLNGQSLSSKSSVSRLVHKKTIFLSDPLPNFVRSLSSHGVVDSKVIEPAIVNSYSALHYKPNRIMTSELHDNYVRNQSRVVEKSRISSDSLAKDEDSLAKDEDSLAKVEFIPDECVQKDYLSHTVENNSSDPFAKVELIPDDTFCPLEAVEPNYHAWWGTVKEDIDFAVESTKAFFENVLFCEEHSEVIYKAFDVISNHSIFETCSIDTKLKVLSIVFDRMQSQADAGEVYLMNAFFKSMSNDDSKKDMTKDEVTSRVLNVIQSYPKVGHRKVTEATRFRDDFEFSDLDISTISNALYLEFKFDVGKMRNNKASCKEISDFYYVNRTKRMKFEDFRALNITGHVFWRSEDVIL